MREGASGRALPAALVALLLIVVVRSAWVCDDALITFRTLDNLVHGYGLRWNVAERVQTFTHPLWLMLLAPVFALTREAYFTVTAVSLLLTAAAGWVMTRHVAGSAAGAVLAAATLGCSKAFVDYSASGLENPLSHLLLIGFAALWLRGPRPGRLLPLAVLAGLGTLNRMDMLLLYLPALALAATERPPRETARALAIGFAPFAAWELFSILYYGFPFPNTAYAKLATGIPRGELVGQGLHYLLSTLRLDPLTALAIAAGLLFALRGGGRERALAAGVAAYLAYVVWIGGDFMSGRFLSAPLAGGAALLARWRPQRLRWTVALPFLPLALLALAMPRSPLRAGPDYGELRRNAIDRRGIADERAFYYEATGLWRALAGAPIPDHHAIRDGRQLRAQGPSVQLRGGVGFVGYYAGPEVYLVEPWAITDPLLARLPVSRTQSVRIGHFTRDIPEGYLESLASGDNRIADPRIAALFDAVTTVTRAPLWSRRRLAEIWKLNRGAYRIDR